MVKDRVKTKTVKQIIVDVDKCIGCRACEMACSAFHAVPKYSSANPARSRIRVVVDELKDIYVPIRSSHYTPAECNSRYNYIINGKEYNECSFCRSCCPSRDKFKEPYSGLPLQCDMCESNPPLEEPWCVKVCGCDALTYAEKEVEVTQEKVEQEEIEIGLESLIDKYGMQTIMNSVDRMSKKGNK